MAERADELDAELETLLEDEDSAGSNAGESLDEREASLEPGVEGPGTAGDVAGVARTDSDEPGRLRGWLGSLFSARWFGTAAIASGVGILAAGAIPLPFTGYLGVLLAGGLIGLVSGDRHYLESAVAGGLLAGAGTVVDVLGLVLVGVGLPIVAVATILGAVCGLVGHYGGRDLRDGLTREI